MCQSVKEPAPALLQERLEGKAMDFADEKAREAQSEIMKMEVGRSVMHVPRAAPEKAHLWVLVALKVCMLLPALHFRVQPQ